MNELVKLGITDMEEIDTFHRLCFPTDYFTWEAWEELLPDPRTLVYAIREGKRLAALLAVYNWQGQDDYVKIMTLCVHPDCRRKGHAKRLLNRILEDMQGQGMGLFKAETRVSNLPMQRLFSNMGFERTLRAEKLMERPVEDGFKYQYRALNIS